MTQQREDALVDYADKNGKSGIIRPEGDILLRTSPNQTQPRLASCGGAWNQPLRMVQTERKRRLNADSANSLCRIWVTLRWATDGEIKAHVDEMRRKKKKAA